MRLPFSSAALIAAMVGGALCAQGDDSLLLPARHRVQTGAAEFAVRETTLRWDPHKPAMVICDMWDNHWCAAAAARVSQMAPRVNEAVKAARSRGVFIIHCPS